jgi:hypothetical protein
VVGQAKRFSREIASGVKKSSDVFQQAALEGLRRELDTMVPRAEQVMQQARARIFGGDTHVSEKLVSIFEPSTEVIRKGKASKPTEFGKMVKIQEAENQIITGYSVYEKRPYDSALLIPAIESHEEQLGRVPRLVAGDAAFYSANNEKAAHEKGVKRVCVPNRNTKSAERKREQKKPMKKIARMLRKHLPGELACPAGEEEHMGERGSRGRIQPPHGAQPLRSVGSQSSEASHDRSDGFPAEQRHSRHPRTSLCQPARERSTDCAGLQVYAPATDDS